MSDAAVSLSQLSTSAATPVAATSCSEATTLVNATPASEQDVGGHHMQVIDWASRRHYREMHPQSRVHSTDTSLFSEDFDTSRAGARPVRSTDSPHPVARMTSPRNPVSKLLLIAEGLQKQLDEVSSAVRTEKQERSRLHSTVAALEQLVRDGKLQDHTKMLRELSTTASEGGSTSAEDLASALAALQQRVADMEPQLDGSTGEAPHSSVHCTIPGASTMLAEPVPPAGTGGEKSVHSHHEQAGRQALRRLMDAASESYEDAQTVKGHQKKKEAEEFTIVVDRSSGDGLGIDASPEEDGTLEVRGIFAGGLVDKWNQRSVLHEQVKPGMRIVEVNGRSHSATQLLAACEEKDVLNITVCRLMPDEKETFLAAIESLKNEISTIASEAASAVQVAKVTDRITQLDSELQALQGDKAKVAAAFRQFAEQQERLEAQHEQQRQDMQALIAAIQESGTGNSSPGGSCAGAQAAAAAVIAARQAAVSAGREAASASRQEILQEVRELREDVTKVVGAVDVLWGRVGELAQSQDAEGALQTEIGAIASVVSKLSAKMDMLVPEDGAPAAGLKDLSGMRSPMDHAEAAETAQVLRQRLAALVGDVRRSADEKCEADPHHFPSTLASTCGIANAGMTARSTASVLQQQPQKPPSPRQWLSEPLSVSVARVMNIRGV